MKRTSLGLAGFIAAAMATAFVGTSAPGAVAATPTPTPSSTLNPGIVDTNHPVTLNVYKFLGQPTTLPHNGTQQTVGSQQDVSDTAHVPLQGVYFDVYTVYTDTARTAEIDLATNAGWATAVNLTGVVLTQAQIASGSFVANGTTYYLRATPTASLPTNNTGLAQFTPLDGPSLYLVVEDLTASTSVQQCLTSSSCAPLDTAAVSPVNPFFVTLPMTDPDNLNAWMYEVFVYPKNQQATGSKTVIDWRTQTNDTTSTGSPDVVTFRISTPITDNMTWQEMGAYRVVDTLDSRLTYVTDSVSLSIDNDGDGNPATGPQTPLLPADFTVTPSGQTVTVDLLQGGLEKLAAHPTGVLLTTLSATITGTQNGVTGDEVAGTIENMATFFPNKAFMDSHTDGTPTTPSLSYYGDLNITKVDPTNPTVGLQYAEFAVYIDPTPASGSDPNTCTADDVNTNVPKIAIGTTGSDGKLTIHGLQTSDFYNNADQANKIWYCLVETKAPPTYNLIAEPISFTIPKASMTASAPAFRDLTVNNGKFNFGGGLPFTGGQGIALLSVIGAVLLGAGVFFSLSSARRRRNAS